MADNTELATRRRRLRLTQWDLMHALGLKRVADISDFEQGKRAELPHGKTRADYERVLEEYEQRGAA